MDLNILLKDEAILDLREAYDWYEGRKQGLGSKFLDYVDIHLQKISIYPNRFPSSRGQRQLIMSNFPFKIIYRIEDHSIIVLGILHQRRNPDSIAERE